ASWRPQRLRQCRSGLLQHAGHRHPLEAWSLSDTDDCRYVTWLDELARAEPILCDVLAEAGRGATLCLGQKREQEESYGPLQGRGEAARAPRCSMRLARSRLFATPANSPSA